MKAPTQTQVTLGLSIVAALGLVYAFTKAKGALGGVLDNAKQALDETVAGVTESYINNIAEPFRQGQIFGTTGERKVLTDKQILYGDSGYTGNDGASGQPVITGEWYASPEARRYEADLLKTAPQVKPVGVNGLTSGYYNPNVMTAERRNQLLLMQTRGRVVGGL